MSIKEFIDSGILEIYVMGIASQSEQEEVEMMAAANPDIRHEIETISNSLEKYALENAIEPSQVIKPFLLATIDYMERLKNGEVITYPPVLDEKTKIDDYAPWLNRPDLNITGQEKDDIFAKIIGYTPEMITAIVWIKGNTPSEIHHTEFERFLIVEGSCDLYVGDICNHLVAGDYFDIPLHEYHSIKVTSSVACKAILQRMAA